jgi:hypothetical protein
MFEDQQQRTVGRKELAIISVVAAAIVALAVTALLMSSDAAPTSASNPAQDAARAEVNRIYEEEVAAAEAAALAREAARQAELNAAEEALNSLENTSASSSADLPPAPEVPPSNTQTAAPAQPGAPAPAPDPDLRPGWVRTKDGEAVNMQAIIESVRAQGTKREKSE